MSTLYNETTVKWLNWTQATVSGIESALPFRGIAPTVNHVIEAQLSQGPKMSYPTTELYGNIIVGQF